MCVSMSTQQIAIFGDKSLVRREELKLRCVGRDLRLHDATMLNLLLTVNRDLSVDLIYLKYTSAL